MPAVSRHDLGPPTRDRPVPAITGLLTGVMAGPTTGPKLGTRFLCDNHERRRGNRTRGDGSSSNPDLDPNKVAITVNDEILRLSG